MHDIASLKPDLHRRWIFLAFLAALHLVFLQGPLSQPGRLLFLIHIGIGLLWQPFIQPKRRLDFSATIVVIFCSALIAYYLSWGLLIVWTMLLTGVVGGKVFLFPNRWERIFHLLGLGYLSTETFALLLPRFLPTLTVLEPSFEKFALYFAPAVFVAMALLPAPKQSRPAEHTEIVDFVYGVMVLLLQAVIVMGSISFGLLFKVGYFESLLLTLAMVAATLLALGLIWHPSSGFGGLGSAVAQHVMSLGLPFEDWLQSLSELGRREKSADHFLSLACAELPERLPGVIGGSWQTPQVQESFGDQTGRRLTFAFDQLEIALITRTRPSPTLLWHYDLACRLLAEYYMGKWRAEELQRLTYLEAIHETGARLTHDMKNLLQTLDTLCVAAEREGAMPSPRFGELLRRQLPEIASRLRQTLLKLSAPGEKMGATQAAALHWLTALQNRFAGNDVTFDIRGDAESTYINDPSLFSSIAENLLQNAFDKRRLTPDIEIVVSIDARTSPPALEVRDNGSAVPAELERKLFEQPVPSDSGLGVGLYQCAKQAASANYRLNLAENRDGRVSFRLEPQG